jgi:cytochrome c biogenesis protein CcdA
MGIESQLPTILTVIITAAIDSVNPCAIGVLILLISVILGGGKSVKRMLFLGSTYVFAVFLVYLLAGLGLTYFFAEIPLVVTEYLSIFVAMILIVAAVIEVKDFFWYGKGYTLGIPPRVSKYIPEMAKNTTVVGAFLLGAFVSAVELPCTGAPYLAIITVLSQYFDLTALLLLVLYNIIFVAPLLIILAIVAAGKRLDSIKQWKEESRNKMRLAIGILLIFLSWLLILIANGTINLG